MSTDGTCTAICCGLCCKWYLNRLLVRVLNNYRHHIILSTSTVVQYECLNRLQRDADAATATATRGVVAHVSLNHSTRIRLTKALALSNRRTQSSLKKVRRWWCQHQRKWGVQVNDPPYYDPQPHCL
ncbi:hypothetical protein K443DRAFT_132502 [Laccaria amethystina LaAM-08-1]|uniref:Uncharacterized protein n=1 Tax=Laccaria amethystina LaAM-08-1 TaxID=1095629 RepID=A0A0C9X7M1_9AGAR|nr:hypothetical protein K443DRAFT_132502 [Laccaria amethystina LaAM-08-1]